MTNKYKKESRKAHKLRKKDKACTYKVAFENEGEAYQKGQEFYKCPYCGMYHRTGGISKTIAQIRSLK